MGALGLALLKTIVSAFFAEALGALRSYLGDVRAAEQARELGRVTAERDQAIQGRDAAEAMAEAAAKPLSEDDAIARLERGEG